MNARAKVTLAHLRQLRHAGVTTKRRGRIPKQRWPATLEVEYAKALIARLNIARRALAPLLAALPRLLEQASAARRVDADESDRLRQLVEQARQHMSAALAPDEVAQLARDFAVRTQSAQRIALGKQVKAALGADVFASDTRIPAMRDHFVNENVALIKSIPGDALSEIEAIVSRAFTIATPHDKLAKEIEQRFSVGESRARLIARDQIAKLYGQTNAYRQKDLGIESFIWRTSGDERVRDEHQALEGQEFRYDNPPSEGLPGEPIQCRCSAEPVFGNLLTAPDDVEPPPEEAPPEREPEARTVPELQGSFFENAPSARGALFERGSMQHQQLQQSQQRVVEHTRKVAEAKRAHEQAVIEHAQAVREHEGFRIGVSSEIKGNELPAASTSNVPLHVAQPHAPLPSEHVPAAVAIQQPAHVFPSIELPVEHIPAPAGYTGVRHEGEIFFKHATTGRAYTAEQISEKAQGKGVVLHGPNAAPHGFEIVETPRAGDKYRSHATGATYTLEETHNGYAAETDKFLLEQEKNPKRPGLLSRLARKIFGQS